MSALLGENGAQDNGNRKMTVHPALYSWREQLPANFVRLLAYLGGVAVLSVAAARIFGPAPATTTQPLQSRWIEIEKPFPAFALSIPEANDVPSNYVVRRQAAGDGRKDIVSLGEPTGEAPFLQVEIYRAGNETAGFPLPQIDLAAQAASVGPVAAIRMEQPLASKFGALSVAAFDVGTPPRHCLGFLRNFADPHLQLSGHFCQGGADYIQRATLACALDRLTLLSAGSEPKIGALFAKAELKRGFCGQHDPILAPTPKYKLLWKALANRPAPHRVGR
jgi:hypothetical protein